MGRSLERAGPITRDVDNAYLVFDPSEEAPLNSLLGHSITCRIATGPRQGQKVCTVQTLPPAPERARPDVAEASGFSLYAGVSARGGDPKKLEHLALTEGGHIRYTLKAPYRDGLRTRSSSPWTLSPGSRPWCPSRAHT